MKHLKLFLLLAGATVISASTFASTPYYGKPKLSTNAMGNGTNVVLFNNTPFTYQVSAYYNCYSPYCSEATTWPIYPQGSPGYTYMITYPVNYPDYQVCLTIPGTRYYNSCFTSGTYSIR